MATYYIDPISGSDSNNGTSWALAWKTITNGATAARIAPNDTIKIAKSPDPTSIGTATWTDGSGTVTLDAAQTVTVDNCETAWTAATGGDTTVTRTATSSYGNQGSYSMKFAFDSAVQTSRLQAYYALPASLNLSAYQELSFWIMTPSTLSSGNRVLINLCSDTAGATVVDSFVIPAINTSTKAQCFTVARTGGGNLGSNINSIAIYTGTSATNNFQFYLDNIIATKTNGLNLKSLISLNSSALQDNSAELWYAVRSIEDTTVKIAGYQMAVSLSAISIGKWHYKTGGTLNATTYQRQPIMNLQEASNDSTVTATINDSGTAGNPITFSGGWNTSSNTIDGMTWFDGRAYSGLALSVDTRDYITLTGLGFCRYYNLTSNPTTGYGNGMDFNLSLASGASFYSGSESAIGLTSSTINIGFNNCGIAIGSDNTTFSLYSNSSSGGTLYGAKNNYLLTGIGITANSFTLGARASRYKLDMYIATISFASTNSIIYDSVWKNAATYAVVGVSGLNCKIVNSTSSGSVNSFWGPISRNTNVDIFNLSTTNESLTTPSVSLAYSYQFGELRFTTLNGDYADNRIFSNFANALSQKTTVHTAGGIAWQVNITDTQHSSTMPYQLPIARVACNANTEVSVSAWVKKSHATDIAARLTFAGYQIEAGHADAVSSTKANDTDWEQLTVTFTPTIKGVYEVMLDSWWVANEADESVYIDDITITEV